MGQTRVDLQHLLEDIRDAYPGALEETILTEIVANSLDSDASVLRFDTDALAGTLTVTDNGSGMARRELARYHDIASSTKTRGEGIGFAGVGIKLGILASDEVLTETRRGGTHVATSWRLASRHKAPWRWVDAPGLVAEHGTAVRLRLRNPLSPLLERGFVEVTLLHHFRPLFDSAFDALLSDQYPSGVRLVVNGREMKRDPAGGSFQRAPLSIRLARKRKPSAVGYLLRSDEPLPEQEQGVAVSTLGKVIKRGWDWLGFTPSNPDRVGGLIEVPGLAESLTLSKADFIRAGARGAVYLSYRKAIQETVAVQLAAWGDSRDGEQEARRRRTRPLERDLSDVLVELAEDFPLIASLVDRHSGGQKRLPMGSATGAGTAVATAREVLKGAEEAEPRERKAAAPAASDPPTPASDVEWTDGRRRRRPTRLGLSIQFENLPEEPGLARLIESTVWINEAHPAYRRAVASRADGYHAALAVAMALAPLAAETAATHAFVTAFLARWGEALDEGTSSRRRRRRPV